MTIVSDADLANMAQAGDVASLGVLLERHHAPLYGLALMMLGHGSDAQDVVQDAFLIAVRKIGELKDPQAVGGWLRAITRNVSLSRLRERHGAILSGLDVEAADALGLMASTAASCDAYLDRLALRDWVWTAIGELPEALRITVMLRYFGAHSRYEDIAAILGVPVGTVKSRLNKARVKLADALLETASGAHDDVGVLREQYTRLFSETAHRYNQGEVSGDYLDTLAPDVVGVINRETFQGSAVIHELLRGDTEAGMTLRPTNVLASKNVVVYEGTWKGPPDDPFHCPPAMTQVAFIRNGRTHEIRLFYATRALAP